MRTLRALFICPTLAALGISLLTAGAFGAGTNKPAPSFSYTATGIGALTGLGARILYKGTDTTLGIISGGIALLATAGTLYLMFGEVAAVFIISMIISVSLAYKIAG